MDLKSLNGTFVNGQRVSVVDLKNGDLIQGGTTSLRVAISTAACEAAAPENLSTHQPTPVQTTEVSAAPAGTGSAVSSTVVATASRTTTHTTETIVTLKSCRACQATIEGTDATFSVRDSHTGVSALCSTCRRGIEIRPQPIVGYQIIRELGHGGMGVVHLALRECDG